MILESIDGEPAEINTADVPSAVLDTVVGDSAVIDSAVVDTVPEKVPQGFRSRSRRDIPRNLSTRMKAYELFSAGVKKSDIARELGVTKTAISRWSKLDNWTERMSKIVQQAESAADLAVGDQVAAVLITLRNRLAHRVQQLEYLCSSAATPPSRLAAIALWFKLAGIKQAIPNPAQPQSEGSLALIQDLVTEEA